MYKVLNYSLIDKSNHIIVDKINNFRRVKLNLCIGAVFVFFQPIFRSGGHVGHASPEKFSKEGGRLWENFVRGKAREWEEMNTDWLQNFTGPLLVLSYSQLKAEVETTLRRTLDFLGVSLTREQLECALKNQEGIYRRRPGAQAAGGPKVGEELAAMLEERWKRVSSLVRARQQ